MEKKALDLRSQGCKILYKIHGCFKLEAENEFLVGRIHVTKQFVRIHCKSMFHNAAFGTNLRYMFSCLLSLPLLPSKPRHIEWCATQAPSLVKNSIVNVLKLCPIIYDVLFL
jgi:hypothetical protein